MKNILFISVLLVLGLKGFGQSNDSIKEIVTNALEDFFKNPVIEEDSIHWADFMQLQNSGMYKNNLKEGNWIEYSIDSAQLNSSVDVSFGEKKVAMNLGPNLEKRVGLYANDKKEGLWVYYTAYGKKGPFYFQRTKSTNFKNGLKNGEEINYSGYGEDQSPIVIINWKDDIQNGIGKIFDINTFKLQKVFNAVNGEAWLTEEYYPTGNLKAIYTDTILNNEKLKHFKGYYEDNSIQAIGYYLNDELHGQLIGYYNSGSIELIGNYVNGRRNGNYKYFYENGKIWSEREYKDGLLWNLKSNYKPNGKKQEKGNLKNGTGTYIIYDKNGVLEETRNFIDGEQVK